MAKPKATESGAQVAALGAAGTVLTAILDALDVGNVAFDEQGWVGVAAIAIGLVYRFAVKWLEARGGSVDEAAVDRLTDNVAEVLGQTRATSALLSHLGVPAAPQPQNADSAPTAPAAAASESNDDGLPDNAQ